MATTFRSKILSKQMVRLQLGSFLAQCIQVGAFPVLLAKHMIELDVEASLIGYFASISWITVLLLGSFIPKIVQSIGPNGANMLAVALALLSLCGLIASTSLWGYFFAAIFMGASLIVRWIVCDILVIKLAPEHLVGRSIGIHEALMGFGIACGPLFLVIFTLEQAERLALVTMLVSCILLFQVMPKNETKTVESPATGHSGAPTSRFFVVLIVAPFTLIAFFAAFGGGFLESATTSLLPISLNPQKSEYSTSVLLVSLFGLGGTLLQPTLGWLADIRGYYIAQMLCVIVILTVTSIILWVNPPFSWMVALMFIFGGAAGGLNTLAVIQLGKTLQPHLIPIAMTIVAMTYTIGSIVGPSISGGAIHIYHRDGLFIAFALIGLILMSVLTGVRLKYTK